MSTMTPAHPDPASGLPRHSPSSADDEFASLNDVIAALWSRRYFIAITTILVAGAALAASLLIEKKYEASVVVSVFSDDAGVGRGGALGSLVSQFGGFASAAGISLSGSDRKNESLAILQSEALTTEFIRQNDLIPVLYADDWDASAGRWTTRKAPTLWKASERFRKKIRSVSTNTKTGLSTLTVSWSDPETAAKWANGLVAMGNEVIRARAIREAERNVAYLESQMKKTNVVAVHNAISGLLEDEFKKIMFAQGSSEYAFKVIDPAVPPERAAFPKPVFFTAAGIMGGLFLSCALVLTGLLDRMWPRGPAGAGR
jgi:uncharacterized protein involved in exopolysaccharide biosynthesis